MIENIKHLYARAGFGISPSELNKAKDNSISVLVDELITAKSSFKAPLKDDLNLSITKLIGIKRNKSKGEKILKGNVSEIMQLNAAWIKEMSNTTAVLQEKMTFFWHDHFGVKTLFYNAAALHNNTLRKFALGKFGDLLHAIAKDPAMLVFLNNQQNKKKSPNENFARELLELFTLGEGNYTEQDIKEGARAFTGWKTTLKVKYKFAKKQHDYGSKTFMGQEGNFNGEDIINILLANKKTAQFITEKIYCFFVNKSPNQKHIHELSEFYYNHDYDTALLLKKIFTAPWFYEKINTANKIKAPIEYLIGFMRGFKVSNMTIKTMIDIQRVFGQTLLTPPSVAGWTSDSNWIDSSSLLYRQKIASAILLNEDLELTASESFDANDFLNIDKRTEKLIKDIEFSIADYETDDIHELAVLVLNLKPSAKVLAYIEELANKYNGNKRLYKIALLLNLPEYQLA